MSDAKGRLQNLCENHFANIAKELRDQDPYQYSRAYSPGLQEFVEAFTYYAYLSGDKWIDWNDLQERLTYEEQLVVDEEGAENTMLVFTNYNCLVQPIEFILGLSDLGGEVMRRCINSLGSGDIESCLKACNFMQHLYTGYLGLSNVRNKEMSRKIQTLRQSVLKVELVCYNIRVRGGEAAVWGADDPVEKSGVDDDEGFANY